MIDVRKAKAAGLAMLAISIAIYAYLAYFANVHRQVYDDLVSWFHAYVIEYIRAGDPSRSYGLRFLEGRNLLRSPILLDYLLSTTGLEMGAWTLAMGSLYLAVVFYASYLVTKSFIIAGFSSLLLSTTPCYTYWFKYNSYGAYTLQPFFFALIVLLGQGLAKNSAKLLIASSIAGIALWFAWSDGWLPMLVHAIYLSALTLKNALSRIHLMLSAPYLALTLPMNSLLGLQYVTAFHAFSYFSLLAVALLSSASLWLRGVLGSSSAFSISAFSSIAAYLVAFCLTAILGSYYGYPGEPEDYSAIYNPLFDYGVAGLLSLLAILTVVKTKMLQDVRARPIDFALISSFAICIALAYVHHPLSVVGIASIAPYISLSIVTIASALYRSSAGRSRLIYLAISAWLIAGSIVASAMPSHYVSRSPPSIFTVDIPRELMRKAPVNESALAKALSSLRGVEGEKLIICYWGYSYWIVGLLGPGAHTLSDLRGSEESWKYYSWILMSDERTAYELVKRIVGNRTGIEVYVLVSEVISVDLTVGGGLKTAELGSAIVVPAVQPGRAAETTFRVHGDLARVVTYIELAGFRVPEYLSAAAIRYGHELPLGWGVKMRDTLLVKLIVNGLDRLGYDVFNDVYSRMYGERILNRDIERPKYFELVNATVTPLYKVERDIYSYQVNLYVAVYRVKL